MHRTTGHTGPRLSLAATGPNGRPHTLTAPDTPYVTASLAKTGILAALLLRTQDEARSPTRAELDTATAMITTSDNAAAGTLWRTIGEATGFDAAAGRLGLTQTTGGADGYWGLTRTTARDQLTLLQAVFGPGRGVLDDASRAVARGLLGSVTPGQDWGVSAAGDEAELKNGWLPRTATGLWVVNSAGRVTTGGRHFLISVLSDGHPTLESGIEAVETASRTALRALTP
ncbi:hypothetical protein DY218_27780 [Streptomyces triticagri]|uniref:Beta-lactamase class A catalytic domain-containing protein n=1 Tax=Streptomyces triticagri TaxID=2293568 RepID=A0A372LY11_9ACTN|nr:serine hydrolase [Streptomyces triticagri]RFU83429.1 hypothetical protein DY218_27780 [Streptomyces triticagri]